MSESELWKRNIGFWGDAAQKLLAGSRVMVVGSGHLGVEVAKAVSVLGVEHIVLGDDLLRPADLLFVERPLPSARYAVDALGESLKRFTRNPGLDIETIRRAIVGEPVMYLGRLRGERTEVVVCASNDPEWQATASQVARERRVPLILGACDERALRIMPLQAEEQQLSYFEDFEGRSQNRLLSSLAAGLIAERVQQILFERNMGPPAGAPNGYTPYSPISFAFPAPVAAEGRPLHYAFFGAGAIMNHVAKNLIPLVRGRVTMVDFDRVELTNLNRCELFWEASPSEYKLDVLERQCLALHPGLEIGKKHAFVGSKEDFPPSLDQRLARGDHIGTMSGEDIAGLGADIYVAGFDNWAAREVLNRAAVASGTLLVDGGSTVVSATITPYVPKRTGCLDCTLGVSSAAASYRLGLEAARKSVCQNEAPSIDASNRVAGALQAYTVLQMVRAPEQSVRYQHNARGIPIGEGPLERTDGCQCPPIQPDS